VQPFPRFRQIGVVQNEEDCAAGCRSGERVDGQAVEGGDPCGVGPPRSALRSDLNEADGQAGEGGHDDDLIAALTGDDRAGAPYRLRVRDPRSAKPQDDHVTVPEPPPFSGPKKQNPPAP
jgi:hypothetical protein